jgi:hypothetical protein
VTDWGDEIFDETGGEESTPALFHATLEDFVREQLAAMYRRPMGCSCPRG